MEWWCTATTTKEDKETCCEYQLTTFGGSVVTVDKINKASKGVQGSSHVWFGHPFGHLER